MQQVDDEAGSLRLEPTEYGQVVAPALAAAAEVAAERGDPHLFNDMASMLALMWMVSGLVRAYRQEVPEGQWLSSPQALDAAPLGACALVFTESGLDESAVDECLSALASAGRMLSAEGVDEAGGPRLETAWHALRAGEHEAAIASLQDCARTITAAIDDWEARRAAED